MKKFVRPLILCAGLAIILSGITVLKVMAQDGAITPQQTEYIRGNCITLKNTLNQTHVSDALLRVNMGQRYELMSTKLMDRFNSRLASNNFSNVGLVSDSNLYNSALDNFRKDYISYEEHLATAISIDCVESPIDFYKAVIVARARRNQVYADILRLNQYIDQYRSTVGQFEKTFQSITEGLIN